MHNSKSYKHILISTLFIVAAFASACSAQQTEEQALASLRQMTSNGKLPPESIVSDIESRFASKKTGALAKLLRARIRYENNDFTGAAAILSSDSFGKLTKVADHALWLRGKSLQAAGNHAEAVKVFDEFLKTHPDSVRLRDAKLLWATSAIAVGRAVEVPAMLVEFLDDRSSDPRAYLVTARAYEVQGSHEEAALNYFWAYNWSDVSGRSEIKAKITSLGYATYIDSHPPLKDYQDLLDLADHYFRTQNNRKAIEKYEELASKFPNGINSATRLNHLSAVIKSGNIATAPPILAQIGAPTEREEGYRQLVLGYTKAKMWPQARASADEMKQKFPSGSLVAKTFIDAGLAARDAKNRTDEGYYLNTAVAAFPNAVEVAQAQFEVAWYQHEQGNFAVSSRMFIDHLSRYVDKDTANRGKAGYWAARDSERAGNTAEACALYDGTIYRYAANWYGYLAMGRLSTLKSKGRCKSDGLSRSTAESVTVAKAVANLKLVTVAAETAGERELARAEKSEELTTIGLFDWAIDELREAQKTAANSPKINLALAKHYRLKGDQVNALLSLAKSYPDYAQMFPEEMGREEWDIFYPLTNWNEIKKWAANRGLDQYQVAGIIRQETIFDAAARSSANAYGLMQLLLPTAKSMARKYGSTMPNSPADLFDAGLNIELGTAYMKDQFAKFGRFEYVGIAYNAGPGRVGPWRASLPPEMDEFVEAIPFKETKGYVQGIIRNSAQYRRLYDDNGNFRPNVGARPVRSEIDTRPREELTASFPDLSIDDARKEY